MIPKKTKGRVGRNDIDLSDIDIQSLGRASVGKRVVSIQLSNVLIYHSKLVRFRIRNKFRANKTDWAVDEIKKSVKSYIKYIGSKKTKIDIDIISLIKEHARNVNDYSVASSRGYADDHFGDCDLITEQKIKKEINNFLKRIGIENKHFV